MLKQRVTLGIRSVDGKCPVIGGPRAVRPGAQVLDGVTIGDGAFIGAGAIVLDNVPWGRKGCLRKRGSFHDAW